MHLLFGTVCSVSLSGDPVLVDAVSDVLLPNRIDESACSEVAASLASAPGGITVQMSAPEGVIERTVTSPEVAAALIESWSNRVVVRRPILTPVSHSFSTSIQQPIEPTVGTSSELHVGTWFEGGLASDDSSSFGVLTRAALSLGWIEPGLDLRFGYMPGQLGTELRTDTIRYRSELLASVQAPISVLGLVLNPGLGVGAGWVRSERGSATSGPRIDDALVEDRVGMRAEASMSLRWPISESVRLDLRVSGSMSGDSGQPIVPAYAAGLPARERALFELAPEPTFTGRLGLGLVVLP